mmetsp:Transcript_109333/g.352967  ORF Transcript_109333/g.352967 Transcript_109333/m.352967 type:complete len:235 (+) Transcript_109333:445-1149(+)
MALHAWRARTNHRLCAALSSSTARTSAQRCRNRTSESKLPNASARHMEPTGRSNTPRKATTGSRPNERQCSGGADVGDTAKRTKVASRAGGLLAPMLGPPTRSLMELLASKARHSRAPKDVVKTRTCSQARMPHQVTHRAQRFKNLSSTPASTKTVACVDDDAFTAWTCLSFARTASRRCGLLARTALAAKRSSCSAISCCSARFGYRDAATRGVRLRGSTGRRDSHSRIDARS